MHYLFISYFYCELGHIAHDSLQYFSFQNYFELFLHISSQNIFFCLNLDYYGNILYLVIKFY